MLKRCSSHSASSVSRILRAKLRSGRQEQDLGELLGDRAAALDDMAGAEIGDRGAHQPDRIDAEMAVEPAVLGRDHRLAADRATSPSGSAAGRTDRRRSPIRLPSSASIVTLGRRSADGELAGVRQGQREIAEHAAADDQHPTAEQHEQPDNGASPRAAANATGAAHRTALRRRPRIRSLRWARNGRGSATGSRPPRGNPGRAFTRAVISIVAAPAKHVR